LTWKIQKSLIFLQTCVEVSFVLYWSNVSRKRWKYYESIKSCVFSTFHVYVVMVTNVFKAVVLFWIKCMVEWMTCCYKKFTTWKRERKEGNKKKEDKKKWPNLWTIHQCYQIGCKLRWTRVFKPCKLLIKFIHFYL
jgi:hypothetical protein